MPQQTTKRKKTPAPQYTGIHPASAPGMAADNTLSSLKLVSCHASRRELQEYFDNGWALTEMLFSGLKEGALYARAPHKLRHPMVFYYAHPPALYVNKLRVAGLISHAINPEFEALFETGVDEMRWDEMHEGKEDWPDTQAVRAYRQEIYELVKRIIAMETSLSDHRMPITTAHPGWALIMGFEHERIHLETSSVLMRELPLECVEKPALWPPYASLKPGAAEIPQAGTDYPENPVIAMDAAEITLGKPHDWPSFGWDNEYGREVREVRPFEAGAMLISNGEFHEFVRDGGYRTQRYWTETGWAWRRFSNVKWPAFWVSDGPSGLHHFRLRALFEVLPMQWDWPAIVNFHEAKAYCVWRSEKEGTSTPWRLVTEAEHHAMRAPLPGRGDIALDPVMRAGGEELRGVMNSNLAYGSESPVNYFPANDKGFHDVFGNVWQWCEDHFHPLEGGQPHPYYDDFSSPCYDGQHQMILGGSFISTGDEASIWARFHFRPHFMQHAGFRIARNSDGKPGVEARRIEAGGASQEDSYKSEELLQRYLLLHYGRDEDIFDPHFTGKAALPQVENHLVHAAKLAARFAAARGRALDLGCGVGRTSFELARDFGEVTGIDYSAGFIHAASRIRNTGTASFFRKDSGDTGQRVSVRLDPAIDRSRITFATGDACALPASLAGYDTVVACNLMCRLPDPAACLARMSGERALVNPGGVLVVLSPHTWDEAYTRQDRWLCDDSPAPVERLGEHLPGFTLLHQEDVPLLIREHRRKFEYIISHATVWRRR